MVIILKNLLGKLYAYNILNHYVFSILKFIFGAIAEKISDYPLLKNEKVSGAKIKM